MTHSTPSTALTQVSVVMQTRSAFLLVPHLQAAKRHRAHTTANVSRPVSSAAASILLIEGLGQQNYGNLNWGDGLITDSATIAAKGISDPNPFFKVCRIVL